MENALPTFYQTLFAVSIAIAGIAIAAVIAVAQIIQGLLSFKTSRKMLATGKFWLFVVAMVGSVAISGLAAILLSVGNHNMVAGIDFHSQQILESPLFALLGVLLLAAATGAFIWLISSEARYLIPAHALDYFRQQANTDFGQKYLAARFASPPTFPNLMKDAIFLDDGSIEDSESKLQEESATDKEKLAELMKTFEQDYQRGIKEYEKDKRNWQRLDNPFAPIEFFIVDSAQKGTLPVLLSSLKTFEGLILDATSSKRHQSNLVRYYSEVLFHCTDICLKSGLSSPERYLVESARSVHESLTLEGRGYSADPLGSFLKTTGDKSIGEMPSVFIDIVRGYHEIGLALLGSEDFDKEEISQAREQVFRSLGWLGERLLRERGPEAKPLMYDADFETEFTALLNVLLGLGFEYETNHADKYPLIYFDALYVVAKALTPHYSNSPDSEIGNALFSLMYEKKTFFEAAIKAKNSDGAALAEIQLESHARLAKNAGQADQLNNASVALLDMGVLAASLENDLPKTHLFDRDLSEKIVKFLAKNADAEPLEVEARELLIKFMPGVSIPTTKAYIEKVGAGLGSDWSGQRLFENWGR